MATYAIAATADDVTYSGTTLEPGSVTFGYDGFNANHVGFRFLSFGPPQGATILSAVFTPQYNADGTGTSPGSWYGAKVANLGAFSAGNNPPAIARTTGTLAAKAYNASDQAHDVTAIIQEIVNQPTYVAGNAIGLLGISQTSGLRYISYKDYSSGAGNAATLVVTWEVTLAALTFANDTTYTNAHNGEVVSPAGGKTSGSTLSVTDPSGHFTASGTNVVATGNVPAGDYPVIVTETLSGATNDGRETSFTIHVLAAPPARLVKTVTGVNTAVWPADAIIGDFAVVGAYRDGNTTPPSLPANWVSVRADTGLNTNSMRVTKRQVTATGLSTGTFTNAQTVMLEVWRPGPGYTLDTGATAVASASSTTISYPTFAMNVTDSSSWVLAFAGHRNLNVALETPPTGMVNRISIVDGTDEAAAHDTNGGVGSWPGATVAGGGSASGYYVTMVEMTVTASGGGTVTRSWGAVIG